MTRQQTQISGKTVYTTPDGQILCNCPGDVTAQHRYSGTDAQNVGRGFWGCAQWATSANCGFFVWSGYNRTSQQVAQSVMSPPRTPRTQRIAQTTTAAAASSMPLASAASSIVIAALEARIEASEAAHRAAEGTIQCLREENNELHSTILELEQRIEHLDELPELLKTTALEFIRDN